MAREVIRRLRPVGEVVTLQDDLQRMFRQVLGDADASLAGAFSPALDVEESDDAFTLHVEVPGVSPDDVDVSIEENVLTVAGKRDFYDEKETDAFRRIERRFGTFHRAIRLPDRVDPEKVVASYKDGLLTVTVPKAESAKPRRIQVSAA